MSTEIKIKFDEADSVEVLDMTCYSQKNLITLLITPAVSSVSSFWFQRLQTVLIVRTP